MISYQEAIAAIDDAVEPLPVETREIDELGGVSSAKSVSSRLAVPAFDNAAMDGFALRAADAHAARADAPLAFRVTGTAAAGDASAPAPPVGSAVEIMTGAPMPDGCDTVIPIERVTTEVDDTGAINSIRIDAPVEAGRNVRRAGEDFQQGAGVVEGATSIAPQHVMALAATGNDRIEARRAPRVAVIVTGSELAQRGLPSGPGMIRDANGPYLESAIERFGAACSSRSHASDRLEDLAAALESSGSADVIVTTGGVSAGRYDYLPQAVARVGGEVVFHKVAIRPGKPLLFARLKDDRWLFGLPGNPIAAAVGLRFFVAPALRRLQGLAAETLHTAVSDGAIRKRSNLTFFGKARAHSDLDGRLHVSLLPGQESFRIAPLSRANCWAVVPDGRTDIEAGELVKVAPLYPTDFLQE